MENPALVAGFFIGEWDFLPLRTAGDLGSAEGE